MLPNSSRIFRTVFKRLGRPVTPRRDRRPALSRTKGGSFSLAMRFIQTPPLARPVPKCAGARRYTHEGPQIPRAHLKFHFRRVCCQQALPLTSPGTSRGAASELSHGLKGVLPNGTPKGCRILARG